MRRDRNPFKNRAKTCQTLPRLPETRVHGRLGADLLKSSLDDAGLRALTPPPSATIGLTPKAIERPSEDSQIPAPWHQQLLDLADDNKSQNQRERDGGHQGCEVADRDLQYARCKNRLDEQSGGTPNAMMSILTLLSPKEAAARDRCISPRTPRINRPDACRKSASALEKRPIAFFTK